MSDAETKWVVVAPANVIGGYNVVSEPLEFLAAIDEAERLDPGYAHAMVVMTAAEVRDRRHEAIGQTDAV